VNFGAHLGRRSGAAEGLEYAFVGLRRLRIASKGRLVLVRFFEHAQDLLKRIEITPLNSGYDRRFDRKRPVSAGS
jgi:hypothetical protein